jgi:hypothetical protein
MQTYDWRLSMTRSRAALRMPMQVGSSQYPPYWTLWNPSSRPGHCRRNPRLGCEKMKFLARDEAVLLENKLRRQIAEQSSPKFVL